MGKHYRTEGNGPGPPSAKWKEMGIEKQPMDPEQEAGHAMSLDFLFHKIEYKTQHGGLT